MMEIPFSLQVVFTGTIDGAEQFQKEVSRLALEVGGQVKNPQVSLHRHWLPAVSEGVTANAWVDRAATASFREIMIDSD